jgi:GNAT superfamily N-acetyltransferase
MRLHGAAAAPAVAPVSPELRVVDVAQVHVDALLGVAVAPGQRRLVSDVARSLAQAAYHPKARALGLFDGDQAVGLLLLYDARLDEEEPADELYVWRLLIDARHQRRGLGAMAMGWVIEEARRQGVAAVGLSHVDREGHAGPFYEKLGFTYTGKVDGEERVMRRLVGG